MAKTLPGTAAGVGQAARALRAGLLVGVPTETVYGLAADALDARACRRIFAVKGRPQSDPLIVHVGGIRQAEAVAVLGEGARRLMRAFWPGPLTLVLPKRAIVPDVVTAGRESVAVRMPAHPLMRRLIAAAGRPLAAPSANAFGYVSPTCAEHVQSGLGKRIPFILDGGPCAIGVESTIVDLRDERRPRLLRPGKIGRAELERVLGRKVSAARGLAGARRGQVISAGGRGARRGQVVSVGGQSGQAVLEAKGGTGRRGAGKGAGMLAPGMLARHYSPHTPLVLRRKIGTSEVARGGDGEAWVFFSVPARLKGRENVFGWAQRSARTEGLEQMGRRLFALLRELDGGRWRVIHAELAPGGGRQAGLAEAINDRLRRAAAR